MLSLLDCFFHLIINSIGFLVQPMISFILPLGLAIFSFFIIKSIVRL